jgi:transcriptional regulator with XRE-family HTH domain
VPTEGTASQEGMDERGPELAALGQAIRHRRHARRLSVKALAREAGISSGHLSVIERGRGNPRLSTLFDIAEALGTTIDQLVIAAEAREVK